MIALVVTPASLTLIYEVLRSNTAECNKNEAVQYCQETGVRRTTLRLFLSKIAAQYGNARRVWVIDRGVPTEAVLAEMRACDPPVQYLAGTPNGRLSRLEKHPIERPWRKAREGVGVKLLARETREEEI